jgi:hypothetical protein
MLKLKILKRSSIDVLVLGIISLSSILCAQRAIGQERGQIAGQILDPSGAAVVGAQISVTGKGSSFTTKSTGTGDYFFQRVPIGIYSLSVRAKGFSPYVEANLMVESNKPRRADVHLSIAVQQESVDIQDQGKTIGTNTDENGSALVIKDGDLDALSDNPDELANQLQALAGPGVGPSGGQIYIDGFTGGQIPPKSTIREIRINQNPFSAEFEKVGFGRIEILTKPGTGKTKGYIVSQGNQSSFNTGNPLVSTQPGYYLYFWEAGLNGPLAKGKSYSASANSLVRKNQNIVNAINPNDTNSLIRQAVSNPSSLTNGTGRIDLQLGSKNVLTIRDAFRQSTRTADGVGQLNLPTQAYDIDDIENALQITESMVVNANWANETGLQWRHIRNEQTASYSTPTVTVSGAFTDGGSNQGNSRDNLDIIDIHNYSTTQVQRHIIRFGGRARIYHDTNNSSSESNGNYIFQSISNYLSKTPDQFQIAHIENPIAQTNVWDGSLFYQDDWRVKSNLTLSYGLRFETQNKIQDLSDWGPRMTLLWAPKRFYRKSPRLVLGAGYGWFYDRFTVPNSLNSSAPSATPYIIQTIHQNGINQQNYVLNSPGEFDPSSPIPITGSNGSSVPKTTIYSIDPKFHAALNMQLGLSADIQAAKNLTFNVNYLNTSGLHQYLSNNIAAPRFDSGSYTVTGQSPAAYNYQYQSGGIYRQNQLIVGLRSRTKKGSVVATYTYNRARSDTQGVSYFPTDSTNPRLDYGRPTFDIRNRLFALGTYSISSGFILSVLVVAQSGAPYNVTIGSDLTENNQFNARPTFGTCGQADVISIKYGCLDTNPIGKGETIIPYGLGTGPANVMTTLRASKTFGIGPRIGPPPGPDQSNSGGTGPGANASRPTAAARIDATTPHRYNLTFVVGALNAFNIVNLGPPNGVLKSELFGKSQSLATGQFASPTPGNRTILLQSMFSF